MESIMSEKSIRKNEVNENKRLEDFAKGNLKKIQEVVTFLPQEVVENPNYENYLMKYGAFTFRLNETKCEKLRLILVNGFAEGLVKYPDPNEKFHNALVIKGVTYPGYEGYGIHQGMEMDREAKNLQRKTTTTVDSIKLERLKEDALQIKGIIAHAENITALKVFNIEILRQSSTGTFGSQQTLFGWHMDDTDRKLSAVLTVIILLTKTTSSMQIMTKEVISYEKQGTAIAFSSTLVHRSCYAEENTIKLCLFFQDTEPTIDFEVQGRVTRNKRIRRQSEDVLETLNWHLGEVFSNADTKILRRRQKNPSIRAENYKEIKLKPLLEIQEGKTSDNEENDEKFKVEVNEKKRVLTQEKLYFDCEQKQHEVIHHKKKQAYTTTKKTVPIDTSRKFEGNESATNSNSLSIQGASKADYEKLAEIYKNHEVFQNASKIIRQEKEEKLVKLRKELQSIAPEMDITPKKKNTTELAPLFQKHSKPVKVQ